MSDVEITELTKMEAEESHLVGGAANGYPALIAKGIGEIVAEEIEAAKAEVSTADQNDLPDSDFAYIEPGGDKDSEGKTTPRSLRHFPIQDAAHVRNALARAPQSSFGDKAMPKIKAAAKKFDVEVAKASDECKTCGGSGKIMDGHRDCPDCDGASKEIEAEISKDGAMGSLPPIANGMPGSPAWEAEDAQRAIAIGQKITELGGMIQQSLAREQTEVQMGQAGDVIDVMALQDAMDAADFMLSRIAPFAFREEAEGNVAEKAGKRLSGKSVTQLVETRKAGRAAIEAITGLLGDDDPEMSSGDGAEKGSEVDEAQVKELLDQAAPEIAKSAAAAVLEALSEQKSAKKAKKDAEVAKATAAEQAAVTAAESAAKDAELNEEQTAKMVEAARNGARSLFVATPSPAEAAKSVEGDGEIAKAILSLSDNVTKSVSALEDRIAKIESQPERGGPIRTEGANTSGAAKDAIKALEQLAPRGPLAQEDPALKELDDALEAAQKAFNAGGSEAAIAARDIEQITANRSRTMLKAAFKAQGYESHSDDDPGAFVGR